MSSETLNLPNQTAESDKRAILAPYRNSIFNQMNDVLRTEQTCGKIANSEFTGDLLMLAKLNLGILYGWVENHTPLGRCMAETDLIVELYRPTLNKFKIGSPVGAVRLRAGGLDYLDGLYPTAKGFNDEWISVVVEILEARHESGNRAIIERIAKLDRQSAARRVLDSFHP